MKKTHFKNVLSLIVCIVLIAAMALFTFGCKDNTKTSKPEETQIYSYDKIPQSEIPKSTGSETPQTTESGIPQITDGVPQSSDNADSTILNSNGDFVLGTGKTIFSFKVVGADKKTTSFEIHTDKTIVGDALQELGLIDGEDGPYGLYVKRVNGITVEYENGGKYWAFYVNGQYAPKGVDQTEINTTDIYSFEVN